MFPLVAATMMTSSIEHSIVSYRLMRALMRNNAIESYKAIEATVYAVSCVVISFISFITIFLDFKICRTVKYIEIIPIVLFVYRNPNAKSFAFLWIISEMHGITYLIKAQKLTATYSLMKRARNWLIFWMCFRIIEYWLILSPLIADLKFYIQYKRITYNYPSPIPTKLHEDCILKHVECLISQAPARIPVGDPNNHTIYDSKEIRLWLIKKAASPVTRAPLSENMLLPKPHLRKLIESRLEFHQPYLLRYKHDKELKTKNLNTKPNDALMKAAEDENPHLFDGLDKSKLLPRQEDQK